MTAPSLTEARRAYDIAHYGGSCIEAENAALRDLMAAEEATESLDERCFRLGVAAADADAEAERHMAAEADAAGRAASRRGRWGDDDTLAASFDREAAACLQLALDAQAEAERLRSQARSLRKTQAFAADVIACLHAAQ